MIPEDDRVRGRADSRCLLQCDSNVNAPLFMTEAISTDKAAVLVPFSKGRVKNQTFRNY